ncbi:hypothetical protein [Geomonas edaphica]|uniref:hypothetical protein n=1 Tax=Geomonas edaphica TaxID=2570226 RepID=UPI0010A87C05|nr:hypothetical protein [Geomonas edaphica]
MERVMGTAGRNEAEIYEREKSGALLTCVGVLAAINLAVLMVVTQLPITSPEVERLVLGGESVQAHILRDRADGKLPFQSCAGGGSVNCHRNGNLSGI